MELLCTELRIGNYLKDYYSGNVIEVTIEVMTMIHKLTQPDSEFQNIFIPIELTEEWLVKFGFEKDKNSDTYFIDLLEYELKVCLNVFSGGLEKDCNWFFSIKTGYRSQLITFTKQYVHQLQNLYSALTGEELEIK